MARSPDLPFLLAKRDPTMWNFFNNKLKLLKLKFGQTKFFLSVKKLYIKSHRFSMGNFPRASPSLVNWLCQDGNYLASLSLGIIPMIRSCGHGTPWWQGVNCLCSGFGTPFENLYFDLSSWLTVNICVFQYQ